MSRADKDIFEITPAHLCAARAFKGWNLDEAAAHTGYERNTLSRLERGAQPFTPKAQAALRDAYARAGILMRREGIFIHEI